MNSLLQGALVLGVALLPGACAAWGYRRHTSSYGNRLRDWLLRLGGLSAAMWCLGGWPVYWVYANYREPFAAGEALPRALALVPAAYLALPLAAGWTLGHGVSTDKRWAVWLTGSRRAYRAWDHLFEREHSGLVRCRMKSGTWIGGLFDDVGTPRSYAAGETDQPDLYLSRAVHLDQRTGAVRYRSTNTSEESAVRGGTTLDFTGGGVLVKWSEIEHLEFSSSDADLEPDPLAGEEADNAP